MQLKDPHKFLALNTDDAPWELQPGEITDSLNVRMGSSSAQHGEGNAETLQGEIEILIGVEAKIIYYGEAIGGSFIYQGFETVQIGSQTWMKKNYDIDYPGSKVYSDDEDNRDIYGGLYQHGQVMASDFCPSGWRVPTEADINTLLTFLGGEMIAGGKMKEVGQSHWTPPNTGAEDNYGFRALPGGKFDDLFALLGANGLLWLADDSEPLAPVATEETLITNDGFTANWLASDGATGYKIDVSESNVFASFMMGFEDLDVGNVLLLAISGLDPGTQYYYRVRAYNEIGDSPNSNVIGAVTEAIPPIDALVDMDDNVYTWLDFGNQQWIRQNLKVTHYANGDAIPNITDNDLWLGTPETTTVKYGYLYNWYATTDARNIAPIGWHVPTQDEWQTLRTFLGGEAVAGSHLKEAGTTHWNAPNTGADNSSGFNARGSGMRAGGFAAIKDIVYWWATDGTDISNGQTFYVDKSETVLSQTPTAKYLGGSLRLVGGAGPTMTGNDGKVYSTVTIGTQTWMAEDLAETKFRNGDLITKVTDNTAWDALISEGYCAYNNDESNAFDITPAGPPSDAYCWYNNDIANKTPYGALYNFYAVDHSHQDTVAGTPINPNTATSSHVGSSSWTAGQSFTLSVTSVITQITMIDNGYNDRLASPDYKIRCSLYNTVLGLPTTKIADSENVIEASIWGDEDHIFTFADIELTDGQYAFIFSAEDVITNNPSNHIYYGVGYSDDAGVNPLVYRLGTGSWLTLNDSMDYQIDFNVAGVAEKDLAAFWIGGIPQTGWRVATNTDYAILIMNLLGAAVAGGKLKEAGTTHWTAPNIGALNEILFDALPAGLRGAMGAFSNLGEYAYFWTSQDPYYRQLTNALESIVGGILINETNGFSVRCVRDITPFGSLELTPAGEAKGPGTYRIVVRDHQLCWDRCLTSTGFDGTEDLDWENIKKIP